DSRAVARRHSPADGTPDHSPVAAQPVSPPIGKPSDLERGSWWESVAGRCNRTGPPVHHERARRHQTHQYVPSRRFRSRSRPASPVRPRKAGGSARSFLAEFQVSAVERRRWNRKGGEIPTRQTFGTAD